MEKERWVKIEGYPKYSVSDHGNVRNDETGMILKPGLDGGGYPFVRLYVNGTPRTCKVHRFVALHFCENPNDEIEVDHIDIDKINNHFTNLRWVSRSNNLRNKKKKQGTTSKYIGVTWYKSYKKWMAAITVNKKRKHLGLFDTEEEASHAFRAAVAFHHLEEFYPPENNL